jgi:hypothetical protein
MSKACIALRNQAENQILECLAAGERQPEPLFRACLEQEEAPFMGDLPFFARLRGLASGAHPLVAVAGRSQAGFQMPANGHDAETFNAQELVITESGQAVLAQRADWVGLDGIDRWLGGVHLGGRTVGWRWSWHQQQLVQADA